MLASMLGTGCLDALTSDTPGYSTHVLPAGAEVAKSAADPSLARRIDQNDSVSSGTAPAKTGYANGNAVSYWELGAAKTAPAPMYELVPCDANGIPLQGKRVLHPRIVDTAPGDSDYTQLWAVTPVCITQFYGGEILSSVTALEDAREMGLVRDAAKPTASMYRPLVADGVTLANFSSEHTEVYYRGFSLNAIDLGEHGIVTTVDGRVNTPNVYELTLPGAKTPARIVFAVALDSAKYAPVWSQYTVVVSETADLNSLTSESDLVTFGDDKSMKPASSAVLAVFSAGTRVARPHVPSAEAP
ncbi:MAG: hypothetical protein RL385_5396 [Pseudomonadota bacterium]